MLNRYFIASAVFLWIMSLSPQHLIGAAPGSALAAPEGAGESPKYKKQPYHPPKGMEKLEALNPAFRAKAEKVIEIMKAKQWPMRIVWGYRTKEENDELVKKGMASRDSRHLYCEALDVIYNHAKESYSQDPNHPYYLDLRDAVQQVGGLRWGGNFTDRWDPTHFEFDPPGDGCKK